MKTPIKLILVNFLIAQIIAPALAFILYAAYQIATTGTVDSDAIITMIIIPAQLTGQLLMGIYLWKAGYISTEKPTWSPITGSYFVLSALAILSCGVAVSAIMDQMKWIPNIMKQTFDILQSGWGGILAIAIVGPVMEELLFRGAITKSLLQKYSPQKAILLSALLFAVFHLNPVQMPPAFLIGILLAWVYYKTASLIPCMWMHVLNNSLSVYLGIKYPGVESINELITGTPYVVTVFAAVFIFIVAISRMCRTEIPYPWKQNTGISN